MEITNEQLQRFIALYEKEFSVTLTPVEAQQSCLSLLRLMVASVTSLDLIDDSDNIIVPD